MKKNRLTKFDFFKSKYFCDNFDFAVLKLALVKENFEYRLLYEEFKNLLDFDPLEQDRLLSKLTEFINISRELMKNITVIIFLIFSFMFTLSYNAGADTRSSKVFKCLGKKIENGDSTYSVLKKCGEPTFKELLSSQGCEKEEKWHYDCYGRGYVEELIFKKGILVERLRGEDSQGTQKCM